MSYKNSIWVEKHRPSTLDDYVFHDDSQKKAIKQMVSHKTIPHLLFSGTQGTGKTTLVYILIDLLEIDSSDVLIINASDEARVDDIRDRIKTFVSTYPVCSEFKIVVLEEADYLHHTGQAILRRMMEESSTVARFIMTCNHENKIIPELKSRTQQFRFKSHDNNLVTEFAAKVLIAEKVKFTLPLLDKYVSVGYPDIRKIINLLQQNVVDGELLPVKSEREVGDFKFALLEFLEDGEWLEARKLVCSQVSSDRWEELFRFLYENIEKVPSFKNRTKQEQAIVIIADHLYKHSLVADPEINVAAMFIRLSQIQ